MKKGNLFFTALILVVSLMTISSSVLGYVVIDPDPPSSTLTFSSRPLNYHLITNGNSITLTWKATTNQITYGYKLYIGGTLAKTGSWSSGVSKTITVTSSTPGYSTGVKTFKMIFYDILTSITDYVYVTISPDSDSDGIGDELETYYTGTPTNSYNSLLTGPTVSVKLYYRSSSTKRIYFNGLLNSNGEGTIPRKLYHCLQKHLCTLSSNIVKIERTDKIKVLHIDTWEPTWYAWIGGHGNCVKSCFFSVIRSEFDEDVDFIYDQFDIQSSTVDSDDGFQKAETEGYDIIINAQGGNFIDSSRVTRLVRDYGTIVVCGTGNDGTDQLTGRAIHDYTIAPGAAVNILGIGIYTLSPNSNYGEGMDFLVDGQGPGLTLVMTSWATGKCAGMALNMLCANQNLDPMTLRNLMRESAIQPIDVTMIEYPYKANSVIEWPDYGWYETVGYGLLTATNCYNAAIDQLEDPY